MELDNGKKQKKPKYRAMDLCWRTWRSYQQVTSVGSSMSQYQKRVSKLTKLANVLFDDLVLLKIFSKKLYYSREIYGQSWATKEDG